MQDLYLKIAKVQQQLSPLKKDSTNPFLKNKYVSLNLIIEILEPLLNQSNLLVTHFVNDGCVVTRVACLDSGQYLDSLFPLPHSDDPQKIGSAVSYARRYSLTALFNLTAEDDDGEAGKGRKKQSDTSPPPPPRNNTPPPTRAGNSGGYDKSADTRPITENQAKRLYAVAAQSGWSQEDVKAGLAKKGLNSALEIPRNKYDPIVEYFQSNRKQ